MLGDIPRFRQEIVQQIELMVEDWPSGSLLGHHIQTVYDNAPSQDRDSGVSSPPTGNGLLPNAVPTLW